GLMLASSDSSAELMQLRQPETFRVLNQHRRSVGNVYPDFKHGRADQRVCLAATKAFHDFLLLRWGNSTVEQVAAKWMQTFPPQFILSRGSFRIELFAFIDQRINHIKLATRFQLSSQKHQHLA